MFPRIQIWMHAFPSLELHSPFPNHSMRPCRYTTTRTVRDSRCGWIIFHTPNHATLWIFEPTVRSPLMISTNLMPNLTRKGTNTKSDFIPKLGLVPPQFLSKKVCQKIWFMCNPVCQPIQLAAHQFHNNWDHALFSAWPPERPIIQQSMYSHDIPIVGQVNKQSALFWQLQFTGVHHLSAPDGFATPITSITSSVTTVSNSTEILNGQIHCPQKAKSTSIKESAPQETWSKPSESSKDTQSTI